MTELISLNKLKEITGYKTAPAVEQCLTKNGVRFLYGRNGIYTTIDAINAAMGLKDQDTNNTKEDIDFID